MSSKPVSPSWSVTSARSSAPRVDERGKLDRILAGHRDLDERMPVVEAGQDVGQERLGVVVGDAEPHRALQPFARQRGHRARLGLHDPAGIIDQLLALRRQLRAAALLDEQGAAELLLEPADVHGNRRLRLVDPLRRAGERAEIDDGEEGAELVGVEHGDQSRLGMEYLYKHSLDRSMEKADIHARQSGFAPCRPKRRRKRCAISQYSFLKSP